MAVLLTPPYLYFADVDGNPLSGGKIYTYAAGTTTPKATYTDQNGGTPASNPIILNSAGRTTIWGTGSYKIRVTDANDNLVEETDDITVFTAIGESSEAYFQSFSGDGSNTSFTLSEDLGTDEKSIMVFVNDESGDVGFDIQAPSVYTLSGTSLVFSSAPPSGTNNIQIWAPSTLVNAASAAADAADTSATESAASAAEALDSANNAANYAAALQGTSTTNITIGSGSKVFTTQTGKQWALGQRLRVASDDSSKIMEGEVTAYAGTSLTINVDYFISSGTHDDWNISITGARGADGDISSLDHSDGNIIIGNGTTFVVENGATARTSLGLGSAAVAPLIDDDTFATALPTNIPSAESVKAYVDGKATSGTWTPVYVTDGAATITMNTQSGHWWVDNGICYAPFIVNTTSISGGSGGDSFQLGGLPFAAANTSPSVDFQCVLGFTRNWATSSEPSGGRIPNGNDKWIPTIKAGSDARSELDISCSRANANNGAGNEIRGMLIYKIAT